MLLGTCLRFINTSSLILFLIDVLPSLQIWGVQDLFVFDHGSFYSDANSSLGRDEHPGQFSLQSLHVQDRGVFELHSSNKDLTSQLSLTNLTVRKLYMYYPFPDQLGFLTVELTCESDVKILSV